MGREEGSVGAWNWGEGGERMMIMREGREGGKKGFAGQSVANGKKKKEKEKRGRG